MIGIYYNGEESGVVYDYGLFHSKTFSPNSEWIILGTLKSKWTYRRKKIDWCYTRYSDRRPPSRNYQGKTHDTEVRWYRSEQNMVERLLNLGFKMYEIEQAYC